MALVTYTFPVSGTTPPSAAKMNQPGGSNNLLIATLNMLDADTTVALVHNFGLSTSVGSTNAGISEQAAGFPLLSWFLTTGETANPFLTFVPTPGNVANSLNVGKTAGSGSGFTAVVQLLRPHSLIQ
jgi:hypothetical protein